MSVLMSSLAKQANFNALSCWASSSAAQAEIPLSNWRTRPNSTIYLRKPAYSNELAGYPGKPATFSNVSAAISCFTPAPADRLHYAPGLPGGGLDIDEA